MIEPTSDHHTDDTNHAVKHFSWGLIPAATAGIALLVQGLTGAVPPTHTGILYVLATGGFVASATTLLWCTSIRIKSRFERRSDAQDAILAENHRIIARMDRSMQALHRKLDGQAQEASRYKQATDNLIAEQKKEVDHLRSLIMQEPTAINGQRLGPRPLS